MDYNHVAQFINLVESGSLSKAAKSLNLAKSNLSRSLQSLEKELGLQLVYRNTRHFSITEAGMNFYHKCKGPMFDLKLATENIQSSESKLRGKLTITTAVDVAYTILPYILSEFSKTYPELTIDVRAEDRIVDLIKEGVDIALRMGNLKDSNLKSSKIGEISLILIASPSYLQNKTKIRNIEQLQEHHLISFTKKYEKSFNLIGRNNNKEKIKIKSTVQCNNPILAKALAVQGLGISLLPDFICYEEIKSGQLIRILSDYSTESSPLHFIWAAQMTEALKVRAFIDFSRDTMKKYFISKSN